MNMRAKYKGILYDASFKSETEVIIRTIKKLEADDSFFTKTYPDGTPVYIKYIPKEELEELYHEYEYVTWKDIEFVIFGGTDENYTLLYSYSDYEKENDIIQKCELFNFEKYDKNVYVKSVPKTEVTNYRIEKEDLLNK